MMKSKVILLLMAVAGLISIGLTSCGDDDDFTASIFDTKEYPLDRSLYTFPLDTFVKKNFLEPYNLKFIYRMEDIGSDLQKNLTPAKYEQSVKLAVLAKYLWYDVYKKYGTEVFLKENSPRIIHVIGSKNYNPSQGTEVLGVAEGGLKITLYNTNQLNENDIDMMNEYFFKTMHHEFGHILDQTHLRPTEFNLLSAGHYDAAGWQETPDSLSAGNGFVTPYASSATGEDWVETLANFITRDSISWERLLGSASYDWEQIDIDNRTDYTKQLVGVYDIDTIGYLNDRAQNGDLKIYRRVCARNADGTVALKDGKVEWLHRSGIDGKATILKKLELVQNWMQQYYGMSIYDLRREVQQRQYVTRPDGTFVLDQYGDFINNLTHPVSEGSSETVIESLLKEVEQYKSLMK